MHGHFTGAKELPWQSALTLIASHILAPTFSDDTVSRICIADSLLLILQLTQRSAQTLHKLVKSLSRIGEENQIWLVLSQESAGGCSA